MFTYRLAKELCIDDVEGWKRRLTVRQLKKWMAYWRVEPFGDDWRRTARGSLTTAAAFGGKPEPGAEEKFLPSYREREQSIDELRAELAKIPAFAKQMKDGG